MVDVVKTKIKKIGGTQHIIIPAKLRIDSKYPFKHSNSIILQIVDDYIIIKNDKRGAANA